MTYLLSDNPYLSRCLASFFFLALIMAGAGFDSYPDIGDSNFEEKIFRKMEFFRTYVTPDYQDQTIEELCSKTEFVLQPQQDFLRIYISPSSPYNGILIFHGAGVGKTCAAISIAENFKESVLKHGQKIYVAVPSTTLIHNFRKELYSIANEKLEASPGALQCTGKTYRPPDTIVGDEERQKWVDDKIKEAYHISGYISLANSVDAGELHSKYGGDIGKMFENTVVIIDEAHILTGENKEADRKTTSSKMISSRPLIKILEEAAMKAKNMKLILMSATPMRDSVKSIIQLVNLLRLNDGLKPMTEQEAFGQIIPSFMTRKVTTPSRGTPRGGGTPRGADSEGGSSRAGMGGGEGSGRGGGGAGEGEVEEGGEDTTPVADDFDDDSDLVIRPNVDYIREMTRGYVSYVRGENPISFAPVIDPDDDSSLYTLNQQKHRPKYDLYGELLDETTLDQMYVIKLVRCPMSHYQFHEYLRIDRTKTRMLSNIVLPKYSSGESMNNTFKKTFRINTTPVVPVIETGLYDILRMENLGKYSQKYVNLIRNVITSPGLHYVYSEYYQIGVITLGMALEMAGFTIFNPLSPESETRMLHISNARDVPKQICAFCGQIKDHSMHSSGACEWSPAKYAIMSGTNKPSTNSEILRYYNTPENISGGKLKVILGTQTSSTGVDYNAVQHVHITEPWHNYTKIYQAIGRATRHCRHKDLDESERYVKVYRYCSTVPDTLYDEDGEIYDLTRQDAAGVAEDDVVGVLMPYDDDGGTSREPETYEITAKKMLTGTSDEIYYIRSIRKDILIKQVERILKENAVDCGLMRNMNYLPKYDDERDGSRACDYTKCNYTCTYMPPGTDPDTGLPDIVPNRDTYYLHHAGREIDVSIKAIKELVKFNKVLTVDYIIKHINDASKIHRIIDRQNILEALDRIVGRNEYDAPAVIYDQYGQEGILVMSGIYYIFQPKTLISRLDPVIYRMLPQKVYVDTIDFAEITKAWKKPVADAGTIDEGNIRMMNDFFSRVRNMIRDYKVDSDVKRRAATIVVWEDRSSRTIPWFVKQDVLWETIWKSWQNDTLKEDEEEIAGFLSEYLAMLGVWLSSIEVHLLTREGNVVTPRCFQEIESFTTISTMRSRALDRFIAQPVRSGSARIAIFSYEDRPKDNTGYKIHDSSQKKNSGKVCTSHDSSVIAGILRSDFSEEEQEIIETVMPEISRDVPGRSKQDLCVILLYTYLVLNFSTGRRYFKHYYTGEVTFKEPEKIEG